MPEGSTIPTADGMTSKADWVRQLQAAVARFQAVDARLTALRVARVELLKVVEDLQESHTHWKAGLAVTFGRRNPELAHFGVKPHVDRRPLSSEGWVVRAEKARQTRLLRHTGGVRQKAALRFEGKVDVITSLLPADDSSGDLARATEPGAPTPGSTIPPGGSG